MPGSVSLTETVRRSVVGPVRVKSTGLTGPLAASAIAQALEQDSTPFGAYVVGSPTREVPAMPDTEKLYRERLARYTTAMHNGVPDRAPIRPFVAEFTARYAGYTAQQVTHDYELAFAAARKCAADFDWDAVVGNMVYVWTGLTQAIGLTYYGVPGVDLPAQTGFQYREPPPERAFMREDEYDALIADPTGFLLQTWLPRVAADVVAIGSPSTLRNNLSFLKGGMAMLQYFMAFGTQAQLLREESGTVSAIAGILKAPFDILADKLRGYVGLTMDMIERPEKVLRACEALAPHLLHVARTSADPMKQVPIGFWMHRGCVPFVTPGQFNSHYWPTLRPIIEELWRDGHQTLFYAEGDWNAHLASFAELPPASIVYHVDRGDIFEAHRKVGDRFCLSGGIPNVLLSYGSEDEVRDCCRKVYDGVGRGGGYIFDASAIMQDDTSPQNLRAMTDFAREHAVYSQGHAAPVSAPTAVSSPPPMPVADGPAPGVCIPWEVKRQELGVIRGDEAIVRRVWEQLDALGDMYIWQVLLSF